MNTPSALAFLCGTDMNPETIRKLPGCANARCIGIGSIAREDFPDFPTRLDRIWGIVLEGVEGVTEASVDIQRRNGSVVPGTVLTGAQAVTDIERVVSEARYWELPVAWWRSLRTS